MIERGSEKEIYLKQVKTDGKTNEPTLEMPD
jgi:hypothetical protein